MPATKSKTRDLQTLAQFAARLDSVVGEHVPFAETLMALAEVRVRQAAVKVRRSAIFEVVKAKYAIGDRDAGDVVLVRRTTSQPDSVLAVASAEVKKLAPELWSRARVHKPHVAVSPPPAVKARLSAAAGRVVATLPPVPTITTPVAAVVAAYQGLPPAAEDARAEERYVEQLRTLGARIGWDGLPIEFADAWKVGLVQLTFSGDRLRELDPAAWDAMAVVRERKAVESVYLRKVGATEDAEDQEFDGE